MPADTVTAIGPLPRGNLYFTDGRNGRFSADDEELAVALAATAAW